MISTSELKAIVKLLADESTLELIKEQFEKFDDEVLKDIKKEIPSDNSSLQNQFLKIILEVKRKKLKSAFKKWALSEVNDLEEGVFLIASFSNPFIDRKHYSGLLYKWARSISENIEKRRLKEDPTSIVNETNHFLFMENGFKGNKENYYDPENSFIDKVIDKKLGNPILLSTIYLLVTKKLGLPFNGVNMPAHFLVKYEDGYEPILVDPFNKGEIITKPICLERVKALNLTWHDEYLSTPTNKQMVARMLQNLINIYHNREQYELKEYLEDYVNVLKSR